ncbi:hypothetical protein CDD82_4806 [Ophiocordyceps australis]|uniref:Peroxin-22-like protein Pex22-like-Penicillium chrysogenum n=1 Tax=Ophiocordyceps australis TaxID=1399860 RepID=A0A2C5Y9I9_9HYPO|nr:hypothetical protein CDD82_4806 [Ophiocordyceps australis]
MSPPYQRHDRGVSRQRVWAHWVPLAVTITIATAGIVTWIWSQRRSDEDDSSADAEAYLTYDDANHGLQPGSTAQGDYQGSYQAGAPADEVTGIAQGPRDVSDATTGWSTLMSNALRHTPSPQQLLASAGSRVAASFAAVGRALSIREEDNPWSEETDDKKRTLPISVKARKRIAVVVAADTHVDQNTDGAPPTIASMLSLIPQKNDWDKMEVLVLIYAPNIDETALEAASNSARPGSLSSSFSNIYHDQGQTTPDEEAKSSEATLSSNFAAFKAIYLQAVPLVETKTKIIPFTTPTGHTHILRQIQPDIIYLEESLAGENGSIITNLQTWLRHDVILVVGADNGVGGLADSEPEAEHSNNDERKWWQRPDKVGRGRGIIVVDSVHVHDDWVRRAQGQE